MSQTIKISKVVFGSEIIDTHVYKVTYINSNNQEASANPKFVTAGQIRLGQAVVVIADDTVRTATLTCQTGKCLGETAPVTWVVPLQSTATPTPTSVTETPTPTPTGTSTPTGTPVTETPTPTPTDTNTPTPTPTSESDPSTPTPTPTDTNTPTPTATSATGTCQFVFVEDTVSTNGKGLQYNLGGEVKTPFPMPGTVTNIGGVDGVVYGICTTTTPQWWDTATNTFTPLPVGVSLLASGGTCQADNGCVYEAPTPTPTGTSTPTPTPTQVTTYYIFDACDGGQTILAPLSNAPLDARLRYVDYSQSPIKYFVYTGNTTTSTAGFTVNSNLQSTGNDQYECLSDTPTPTPTPPPQSKFTTSPSPFVSISSNGSDDSTFTITVTETVNLKGTMICNTGSGTGTLTLNVPGQGNVTTGPVQYAGFGSNDTGAITLSPGTYTNSTLTLTGSGAQGQLVLTGDIFEA